MDAAIIESVVSPIYIVIIYFSIYIIRKTHPSLVNTLWYLFSLSTILFIIVEIYYVTNGSEGDKVHKTVQSIMDMLIAVNDEFSLVGSFVLICLVPQLISYLLSGLFGCASQPRFVSDICRISTLSLSKFFCVYAAVEVGEDFCTYILGIYSDQPVHTSLPTFWKASEELLGKISEDLLLLSASFLIAALYYGVGELRASYGKPLLKFIRSTDNWMTRYNNVNHPIINREIKDMNE